MQCKKRNNRLLKTYCLSLLMTFSCTVLPAFAQDEEAEALPSAAYVPLKPPFVVNYGGQGKLKYLKAEISLRVTSPLDAKPIRHHMPYIRNNLILLFARQTEETLDTTEGKELLRQAALEEINNVLIEEEGETPVVDLFFSQFVIQK